MQIAQAIGVDHSTIRKVLEGARAGTSYIARLRTLLSEDPPALVARKPAGLAPADEQPVRRDPGKPIPFPRPVETPKPEPMASPKPSLVPWISWAKPLTKEEATSLSEPFQSALVDYFEYLDKALWKIGGDATQKPIWSDMTKKELDVITRVAMRAAQRSAVIATAVHSVLEGRDWLAMGIILGPRLYETGQATIPYWPGYAARRKELAEA